MSDPGKKSAASRQKKVEQLLQTVRGSIFDEFNRPGLGEAERETATNLMLEAGRISKRLSELGDDESGLRDLERLRIRPLVHGIRRFALRRNVTVTEPFWGLSPAEVGTNSVFFVGSKKLRRKLEPLCADRDLDLVESAGGWGAGLLRWDGIRTCFIAIFDLTSDSATDWPSIYHALGTSLALGIYPMVVADSLTDLKFDIDLEPVSKASLADGLDRALFAIPRTETSDSLPLTVSKVMEKAKGQDPTTMLTKKGLMAGEKLDPLQIEKALSMLAWTNGGGKWGLVFPIWPSSYPDPNEAQCFHIMPFSESWSNDAREAARRGCGDNVRYRRGDETDDPNVIRSIWREICAASHIIVDLTGLNCNVCLELALCHALGRNILLVARDDGTIERLFPEISKLQIKKYETEERLTELVRDFVSQRQLAAMQ